MTLSDSYIFSYGEDKPHLMIFLHGFLGSYEDFLPFYDAFSSSYHCMGINWMQWCYDQYHELSFHHINKLLHDLILSYSTSQVTLVGYSMGGRVAMRFKKAYPHLCDKLILLSANTGHDTLITSDQKLTSDFWIQELSTHGVVAFLRKWYEQPLFHTLKSHQNLFESLLQKRSQLNAHMLIDALQNLSQKHQDNCLSIINNDPNCLILIGEEDEKYVKLFKPFISRFNLTQIVMIPNISHMVHLEAPKACIENIRNFLLEMPS